MLSGTILLILCLKQVLGSGSAGPLCRPYQSSWLVCENFINWTQISNIGDSSKNYSLHKVGIKPDLPLILTPDINYDHLASLVSNPTNNTGTLLFKNLIGIDTSLPTIYPVNKYRLVLKQSWFQFYSSDRAILKCQESTPSSFVFSLFDKLIIDYDVDFVNKICPYLFRNATLTRLLIFGSIRNSRLKASSFQIDPTPVNTSLNSHIKEFFILNGYNLALDNATLDSRVFAHVSQLIFGNLISYIQKDLFKTLRSLKLVCFAVSNLASFFHTHGMEWSFGLNQDLGSLNPLNFTNTETSRSMLVLFSAEALYTDDAISIHMSDYSYPDLDWCIFEPFPYNQLVYPLIHSSVLECNCNLATLVKDFSMYNELIQTELSKHKFYHSVLNNSLRIIALCSNFSFSHCSNLSKCSWSGNKSVSINYQYLDGREINFSFAVVLTPIVCFIGMVLNIMVLRDIHEEQKTERSFQLMSIIATLNSFYCFINLFNLLTVCINMSNLFCSSIYTSQFAQYFKLIAIVYIGESLKSWSNFLYLMLTVDRFVMIGQDHPWIYKEINEVSIKKVLAVTCIFSMAFNVIYLFQYGVNDGNWTDYIYSTYSTYPQLFINNKSTVFFLHSMFNYIAFALLISILEVAVLIKTHHEIQNNSSKKIQTVISYNKEANEIVIEKKDKKVSKIEHHAFFLIGFNCIIYFVLRFPEMLLLFQNYPASLSTNRVYHYFCVYLNICHNYADIVRFFYLLTFLTNYLLYYALRQAAERAAKFDGAAASESESSRENRDE